MPKIGFVIPTAFNRPQYLPLSFTSIADQQGDFEIQLVVGCPPDKIQEVTNALPAGAQVVAEPSAAGLAAKLDGLLKSLDENCDFIGWLGDDDLLTVGSLNSALQALLDCPSGAMAYGGCDYIDESGNVIFTNTSGAWAAKILQSGPQLIPQPGSLMRASAFRATGGLSNEFALAFDFDLFLKLKKQGELIYVPKTLAQFRWHPNSLSVRRRLTSALEASKVRRAHYSGLAKLAWPLWEPLVIAATWVAGKLVSFRTARLVK